MSLYEKTIDTVKKVIKQCDSIQNEKIKTLHTDLEFLRTQDTDKFTKTIKMFMDYISLYHNNLVVNLPYITLYLYYKQLKSPQGKFPIGAHVKHNNKPCVIIDYMHDLNLYEIQYDDVSVFKETHGWFREESLQIK